MSERVRRLLSWARADSDAPTPLEPIRNGDGVVLVEPGADVVEGWIAADRADLEDLRGWA